MKVMVLGMLLLGCKVVKNQDTKELHFLSATRQKLHTGAKGGGIITEYNIFLKASTNQALPIDTVWTDDKKFHPKILDKKTHTPAEHIQAGDTLLVIFSAHTSEPAPQKDTQAEGNLPIAYQGAALLRYFQGNRPQYLVIPAFTDLEPVYAP